MQFIVPVRLLLPPNDRWYERCPVMRRKRRRVLCCGRERFFVASDPGALTRLQIFAVAIFYVWRSFNCHCLVSNRLICFPVHSCTLDLASRQVCLFFCSPDFNLCREMCELSLCLCACVLHRCLLREGTYWVVRLCPASKWVGFKVRLRLTCVSPCAGIRCASMRTVISCRIFIFLRQLSSLESHDLVSAHMRYPHALQGQPVSQELTSAVIQWLPLWLGLSGDCLDEMIHLLRHEFPSFSSRIPTQVHTQVAWALLRLRRFSPAAAGPGAAWRRLHIRTEWAECISSPPDC